MNDVRTVSVRLTEQQIDDITEFGGGSLSNGVRQLYAKEFGTANLTPDRRTMAARLPAVTPMKSIATPVERKKPMGRGNVQITTGPRNPFVKR